MAVPPAPTSARTCEITVIVSESTGTLLMTLRGTSGIDVQLKLPEQMTPSAVILPAVSSVWSNALPETEPPFASVGSVRVAVKTTFGLG
jgi:hypothetical protein